MASRRRHLGFGLAAIALWLVPAAARAQQAQAADVRAQAEELFKRAKEEMDAKKYADACPRLEEIVRLKKSIGEEAIGAKLKRGDCYRDWGRFASAHAAYEDAAASAARAHDAAREQEAHSLAAAIAGKVAHLTIVVPAAVAALSGLAIKLDDRSIGVNEENVAVPVDAIPHSLAATANGMKPWSRAVDVTADGSALTVTIGPLARSAPADTTAPATTNAGQSLDASSARAPNTQRIAGVLVGAAGLVAIGAGAVFGVMAIQKRDASNDPSDGRCVGDACPQAGYDLRKSSLTAGTVSTVMFAAGSVAVAGGVVLFATAPKGKTEPMQATVSFQPGAVVVRGLF